jgi:hypothetical protein
MAKEESSSRLSLEGERAANIRPGSIDGREARGRPVGGRRVAGVSLSLSLSVSLSASLPVSLSPSISTLTRHWQRPRTLPPAAQAHAQLSRAAGPWHSCQGFGSRVEEQR